MRRRLILAVFLALAAALTSACGGGLAGLSARVPCPSTIEAPSLYPGDAWTFRNNDGHRWRQAYDATTDDGLLRGRGPEPNTEYYYDQAHTLRRVHAHGVWLTWDTPEFPEIGKPELEFPLTVGKIWTTTWYTYAFVPTIQDSRVAGCEMVTVPAGTFMAARIEVSRRDALSATADLRRYTLWYAPAVKYWVKGTGGTATLTDPFLDFVLESFSIDAGKPAVK